MQEEVRLELVASLFTLTLQEIGNTIISQSWKASDEIMKSYKSGLVLSGAIEVCALLLHQLSRTLPVIDGDPYNDVVYTPLVRYCSRQMGDLVEHLQDDGVFSMPLFSGDNIETETLSTIEERDLEYAKLPQQDLARHAYKIVADLVGQDRSVSFAYIYLTLFQGSVADVFATISPKLQEILTPDLLAYLRKEQ